jgi:hypothetical protein
MPRTEPWILEGRQSNELYSMVHPILYIYLSKIYSILHIHLRIHLLKVKVSLLSTGVRLNIESPHPKST